jgi:hypothetical protein
MRLQIFGEPLCAQVLRCAVYHTYCLPDVPLRSVLNVSERLLGLLSTIVSEFQRSRCCSDELGAHLEGDLTERDLPEARLDPKVAPLPSMTAAEGRDAGPSRPVDQQDPRQYHTKAGGEDEREVFR